MANMSYCRFENTVNDLRDCRDALEEIYDNVSEVTVAEVKKQLSESEYAAMLRLLNLCQTITINYGEMVDLVEGEQS